MSKETKTPKTFTTKQVTKALAPYAVILVLASVASGLISGWVMRSDFDSTIRNEVTVQFTELKKADK